MTQKNILEKIENKLDEIWKILSGNGQAGLCEKVRKLENAVFERPDFIGKWVMRILMALIAAGQLLLAYKIFITGVK